MKVRFLHRLILVPLTLLGGLFLVHLALGLRADAFSGQLQEVFDPENAILPVVLERWLVALGYWFLAAILTYGLAVPFGMMRALNHSGLLDRIGGVILMGIAAIPGFVLAIVLSNTGLSMMLREIVGTDLSPVLCYSVVSFSALSIVMKGSLMNELAAGYLRTAISKGTGYRRAVLSHALRNALLALAPTLGPFAVAVVGSSMLIEFIFGIQGLGLLQLEAVQSGDALLVMTTVSAATGTMLVGKFSGDILGSMLEPRRGF